MPFFGEMSAPSTTMTYTSAAPDPEMLRSTAENILAKDSGNPWLNTLQTAALAPARQCEHDLVERAGDRPLRGQVQVARHPHRDGRREAVRAADQGNKILVAFSADTIDAVRGIT